MMGLDNLGRCSPKSGEIAQGLGRSQGQELSHPIRVGQIAAGTVAMLNRTKQSAESQPGVSFHHGGRRGP